MRCEWFKYPPQFGWLVFSEITIQTELFCIQNKDTDNNSLEIKIWQEINPFLSVSEEEELILICRTKLISLDVLDCKTGFFDTIYFVYVCVFLCVHVHTCTHMCLVEEGRALSTVSEKSDTPSPSPLSERRSWSSSPPHSLYTARIPRKQQPDHLQRTSVASGRFLKHTYSYNIFVTLVKSYKMDRN